MDFREAKFLFAEGSWTRNSKSSLPSPNRTGNEQLRWQHVVISLQTVLERPFVVGGRTALELQGFAHYLGAGELREVVANEGISDETRRAFIVYLVSTNRPFAEILAPTRLDIAQEFARGFDGMTDSPVTLDDLVLARRDRSGSFAGRAVARQPY